MVTRTCNAVLVVIAENTKFNIPLFSYLIVKTVQKTEPKSTLLIVPLRIHLIENLGAADTTLLFFEIFLNAFPL
jgi:hypothetical protein